MNGMVKICGITDASGLEAALKYGADFVGFVFREDSPRFVSFEAARHLAQTVKSRARISAVTADADDAFLEELVDQVRPDILQLHGFETPHRVAMIAKRFRIPVCKTLGIAGENDLDALSPYEPLCEKILLEAKAPHGGPHGGSGRSFDWKLLARLAKRAHIMLAGGLTPKNVSEAIMTSGVNAVDVASGVEQAPGIKDETKIRDFITAARAAFELKQAS